MVNKKDLVALVGGPRACYLFVRPASSVKGLEINTKDETWSSYNRNKYIPIGENTHGEGEVRGVYNKRKVRDLDNMVSHAIEITRTPIAEI